MQQSRGQKEGRRVLGFAIVLGLSNSPLTKSRFFNLILCEDLKPSMGVGGGPEDPSFFFCAELLLMLRPEPC